MTEPVNKKFTRDISITIRIKSVDEEGDVDALSDVLQRFHEDVSKKKKGLPECIEKLAPEYHYIATVHDNGGTSHGASKFLRST